MRTVWKISTVCAWLVTMTLSGVARANPELPAQYDARSVGMGGTGVSFLDGSAGGVFHNPALLDGIERLDVALTVAPFIPTVKAPLAQPGTVAPTEQGTTETSVIPLGLLSFGYRVHERITLGLGLYVASGMGGEYKNASIFNSPATPPATRDRFDDFSLTVAVIETALPISVRLTKNLSLGAAWRTAYVMQGTTALAPNPVAPGAVNRIEQDLSGASFLGANVGLRLKVNDMLSLGLSYRSKMTTDLEGTTDVEANTVPPGAPNKLVSKADTTSEWSTPHQVRLGASLALLDQHLLLSIEGRMQMFKDANKELVSDVDLSGQPLMGALGGLPTLTNTTKLDWGNAYTGQVGAEYRMLDMLALRAGFTVGNSASSKKYPGLIAPPPGVLYSLTAGVGATFTHFEAGLAGSYQSGSANLKASDIAKDASGAPVASAGTYEANLVVIAASCAYRM